MPGIQRRTDQRNNDHSTSQIEAINLYAESNARVERT